MALIAHWRPLRLRLSCGLKQPGQRGQEEVGLPGGQDQRRCQAHRARAGAVDDEPGVEPGGNDAGGDVGVEVESDQQTIAADLGHAVDFGKAGAQVLPYGPDVGQDILVFKDVQGGEGRRGGHRVAAEGGPVLAGRQQRGSFRAEGHEGTDREAAAQALGQGHGVGQDPGILAGQPLAGTADAGLHLVEDQQGAGRRGGLAGSLEIAGWQRPHARLALDWFEEDGGGGVVHRRSEGLDVAEGNVHDTTGQRRERCAVGLFGGQGEGAHGAAVEGAFERDDLGAPLRRAGIGSVLVGSILAGSILARAGVPARQFEGCLHGFGAGVGEEHLGPGRRLGQFQQLLGQGDLGGAGEEVGDVPQGGELAGDHRGDERVGVAQGVDRDSAEQVQVFLAVGVPHEAAGTADQDPLRGAEDTQQGG